MKLVGVAAIIFGAGLVGCASAPPPELVDARTTYARASQSPEAKFAVSDMREAQLALDSVRKFLAQQGVDDRRMDSVGMGKAQPVADNSTPEGRANNRRVEIVLKENGGR